MKNKEVPIFTKIDLMPWGAEEFYLYVIPEDTQGENMYSTWVFCKDLGAAFCSYAVPENHLEAVAIEHIKALDEDGYFDYIKEKLYELL